ncbi:hypothetical protein QLS31_05295 [Flavobacterium sp. XS2P24]|nr:hypothetical protein [Flavobacterium sp. XS2P24]
MRKYIYIFICLLLSVEFWQISYIINFLNFDAILILTIVWALCSFHFFRYNKKIKTLYSFQYKKYSYWIFLGVFISMLSAYFTWGQEFLTTFIAQRYVFSFIILPAILYAQPTEKDIIKALKWISIGTILVWIFYHFDQNLVFLDENKIEQRDAQDSFDIDRNYYVHGIYYIVLYLYFKIAEYIKKFSLKTFLEVSLLLLFLILYQNRSMLLVALPVFGYSILKFNSKYKLGLVFIISLFVLGLLIYTLPILEALLYDSQNELSNLEYNRWKSLWYYSFEYSPNWFCYIFGNGFPSGGNSALGNLMWSNFTIGIYASDIGMIGMWATYGIIPLIVIYIMVVKIIKNSYFPLYLKFISFHILFVPTIFHFWRNPGLFFFVIFIYLYCYYEVTNKQTTKSSKKNQ